MPRTKLFSIYKRIGSVPMLEIIEQLVLHALGRPRQIESGLPRAGRATLRNQPSQHRDVLHLLHANPVLRGLVRGDNVQPIQDLVTLTDVDVSVAAAGPVRGVRLVPDGGDLSFTEADGRVQLHRAEPARLPDGGDRLLTKRNGARLRCAPPTRNLRSRQLLGDIAEPHPRRDPRRGRRPVHV